MNRLFLIGIAVLITSSLHALAVGGRGELFSEMQDVANIWGLMSLQAGDRYAALDSYERRHGGAEWEGVARIMLEDPDDRVSARALSFLLEQNLMTEGEVLEKREPVSAWWTLAILRRRLEGANEADREGNQKQLLALMNDPDDRAVRLAGIALAYEYDFFELLQEYVEKGGDIHVRFDAACILGKRFKKLQVSNVLYDLWFAIAHEEWSDAFENVKAFIDDTSLPKKRLGIPYLAQIQSDEAQECLVQLLKHSNSQVSFRAALYVPVETLRPWAENLWKTRKVWTEDEMKEILPIAERLGAERLLSVVASLKQKMDTFKQPEKINVLWHMVKILRALGTEEAFDRWETLSEGVEVGVSANVVAREWRSDREKVAQIREQLRGLTVFRTAA